MNKKQNILIFLVILPIILAYLYSQFFDHSGNWLETYKNDFKIGFFILAIAAIVIAPIAASAIQLAISRRREYLADATGAMTTRYPEGLASALEKIGKHGSALQKQNSSTAHLFFANPLKGGSFANLFSTHPPIEDRVRILREIGDHE